MAIFVIGFDVSKFWFRFLFVVLPSILILFTTSLVVNKLYFKSIEFDDDSSIFILTYFKYDKKQKMHIEYRHLDIRVSQVQYSVHKYYKIQIFNNKKVVFQQREFMEWDKATFDKIVAHFKELKLANINSAK